MTRQGSSATRIDVAPAVKEFGITRSDLLQSVGTVEFKVQPSPGYFFRVQSPGFAFELGLTRESLYISRNRQRLEAPLSQVDKTDDFVYCFAIWQPTELSLVVIDKTYNEAVDAGADAASEWEHRTKRLATPPTLPPNSLIEWVRKQLISPLLTYKTTADFRQEVVSSLQSIPVKIEKISNLY